MDLFDELVSVHYGFIRVFTGGGRSEGQPDGGADGGVDGGVGDAFDDDGDDEDYVDPVASMVGQTCGLIGARVPGVLSLVTGLHTGDVPLTVTWDEQEPPLGEEWADAVEVSAEIGATRLAIETFEDGYETEAVPVAGWHRARYCAAAMDAGSELDTPDEGEDAPDRYLLQLWPAPEAPEALVRQGSEIAAYWHRVARGEDR